MKPREDLKSLFSPYEIAVVGALGGYAFCLAAIVALFAGFGPRSFIAAALFATLAFAAGWALGRCPACGKPALKRFLLNREDGIGQFMFAERLWPERECSSCRTPLDRVS